MFGLKFSKEDHVSLIRLFYQVLVQVDMDPPTMYQAAITLNTLLESRHLIEASNVALAGHQTKRHPEKGGKLTYSCPAGCN